jgi:hypothetical protein
MQFSPISGQDMKSVPVTSPDKSLTARPHGSNSPRANTIQLSCRSPNGNTVIGTALRIGSFYAIESSFTRLREALKPDRKASRTTAAPALLNELQTGIKVSTHDAEDAFNLRNYALCRLHLEAAKSNQVAMLGKIDDIEDAEISEDNRIEIRGSCVELGAALTKMLIQAKTMESEFAQKQMLKQQAHDRDSDSDATPPSSPRPAEPTQASSLNSPVRTRQKRAQGDADSPVLLQSPAKRQKNGNTTRTSTATTTSTAVPQSPPAYRPGPGPGPLPTIEHDTMTVTPVTSPNKPASGSSTSTASPQKMRPLSPQPRPRPRSQLFVAPPDFTRMVPGDTAEHPPAVALLHDLAPRRDGTPPGPLSVPEQPID